MNFFSVSGVARQIGAKPKDITDLFYQRKLDDRAVPYRRPAPDSCQLHPGHSQSPP